MRFISRGALAASVAALALSVAGVATAAAALPEFVPDGGAKFPITASGSVSVHEGAEETAIQLDQQSGGWIDCKTVKYSDEITAAKAISLTTDLERCHKYESLYSGHECTSTGAATGVIALSGKGSLVYLEKATKKVGVLLTMSEFDVTCKESEPEKARVEGSLLAQIAPVNTEITKYELLYHQKTKPGFEEFTSYENESGKLIKTEFIVERRSSEGLLGVEIGSPAKTQITANHAFTISA
jgi:hypothetical protein